MNLNFFKSLFLEFYTHTILVFNNLYTLKFQNFNYFFFIIPFLLLLLFFFRKTFFSFNDLEQKRIYHKKFFKKRIFLFLLYFVLLIILFLSFSNPYISYYEKKHSNPKTTIFLDESSSMNNYDTSFLDELYFFLKQNNVSFKTFNFKKSYSEIISFVEENTPMIVVSDDNMDDAVFLKSFSDSLNSSILLLNVKPKNVDLNVKIESPNFAFKNDVFDVNVVVDGNSISSNKSYILKVYYNNKSIFEEEHKGFFNYSFKLKSKNLGFNVLEAKIILDDAFENNNVFYKTFYVFNPPVVSLFSYHENSPLKEYLSKTYSLKNVDLKNFDFNNEYKKNNILIIDDVPYKFLKPYVLKLSEYVVNGNSVIFFGGKNSFDYDFYENSILESFLPVKIGSSSKKSSDSLNVVFLIDISGSTGQQFSNSSSVSIQNVEKNLVLSAYNSLKDKDRVSVIAFNNFPFVIADMNVKSQQKEVEDRILKLKFFGGTRIKPALEEAVKQLSKTEGKKYIVLFSDGYSYSESEDLLYASKLKNFGIKLYTVSVGENSNVDFLKKLSMTTYAKFFKPSEKSKFNILFENSKSKSNLSNELFLSVWDDDNFITKNLYLDSYVKGFNQVYPKSNGRVLIVTSNNNPILTFSYFGLGKILVFSSDNGLYWSSDVFKKNSDLFSRMINFGLGSFNTESFYLQHYFSGENTLYFYYNTLSFNSDDFKLPLYYYDFNTNSKKLYSYIVPLQLEKNFFSSNVFLKPGKYYFLNKTFIINYNREFDYKSGLKKVLNKNNILNLNYNNNYDTNDFNSILNFVVENSYKERKVYEYIQNYFLLLAVLWYFLIVFVRKTFYKE